MIRSFRWFFVGASATVAFSASPVHADALPAPRADPAPQTSSAPPADPGPQSSGVPRGYELGRGLALGTSGFTLGGYAEASWRDVDDGEHPALSFDALSAMLWWDNGGPLHFFSETELDDALVLQEGGSSATGEARVVSERLYVDWTLRDAFNVRAGKFLTPIGRWNVIHAAPLTWTTSRPLITEATFPTNATGVMVYGTLPGLPDGIEYSVYGSGGKELFRDHHLDTFSEAVGARLAATVLPHTQIGISYATYEQESDEDIHKHLAGIDFEWRYRRFDVSGEFARRTLDDQGDRDREDGLYVQLVAPLAGAWYGVARYERFNPETPGGDLNLYLGGVAWRPLTPVVVKLEYSHATTHNPDIADGLRASAAVLF